MLLLLFLLWFVRGYASQSVIIIGAGPSGLAAATKLLQNNITNVKILEAENRIGGRIFTAVLEGDIVEIGAEYCHGQDGNVVYDVVKDLKLLVHSTDAAQIYYSNGHQIADDLSKDFFNLVETFDDFVEDTQNESANKSLGELFLQVYNEQMTKYRTNNPKIFDEGKTMGERLLLSLEGAFSWDSVAAKTHYKDCGGDLTMTWKNGYNSFLRILMKDVPISEKIHLNKEVTEVNWNSTKTKVVTQSDTFEADHVIFTPSVGVLKHGGLFVPELPNDKQYAANAIGFDGVIKVLVHFPSKWWDQDAYFFLWSNSDKIKSGTDFPFGHRENNVSWVASICSAFSVKNSNVLVAWITGKMVPEIEKIPEEIIKDGVAFVFQKFLGTAYNVTTPDKILRSQWRSNPHFRGTYSYEKKEYYKENYHPQDVLAEPLRNANGEETVQFAGEATNDIHFSTVHGAVETGWREAERIINKYNKV